METARSDWPKMWDAESIHSDVSGQPSSFACASADLSAGHVSRETYCSHALTTLEIHREADSIHMTPQSTGARQDVLVTSLEPSRPTNKADSLTVSSTGSSASAAFARSLFLFLGQSSFLNLELLLKLTQVRNHVSETLEAVSAKSRQAGPRVCDPECIVD